MCIFSWAYCPVSSWAGKDFKSVGPWCGGAVASIGNAYKILKAGVPEFPNLTITPSQLLTSFDRCQQSWLNTYDANELSAVIVEYKKLGHAANTKDRRKVRRPMRKAATLYKAAFVLFSEPHEAPEELSTLNREMGRLNDLVDFGEGHDRAIKDQAKVLMRNIAELNAVRDEVQIVPTSQASLAERFSKAFTEDTAQLQKPRLTIYQFHEIRKHVREVRNVYTLLRLGLDEQSPLEWTRIEAFLSQLNSILGSINNQLLQGFLRWRGEKSRGDIFKEREAYDAYHTMVMPSVLVKDIITVMERFHEALATAKE